MQGFQRYFLLILSFKFRVTVPLFVLTLDFRLRWRALTCGGIYARVYCVLCSTCTIWSRSLSHLLTSFLLILPRHVRAGALKKWEWKIQE